jgi:hypothetical protein
MRSPPLLTRRYWREQLTIGSRNVIRIHSSSAIARYVLADPSFPPQPLDSLIDHADEFFFLFFFPCCAGHEGSQCCPWFELMANYRPTHTLFQSTFFRSFLSPRYSAGPQIYSADLAFIFRPKMKRTTAAPPSIVSRFSLPASTISTGKGGNRLRPGACMKEEVSTMTVAPPFNLKRRFWRRSIANK